LLTVRPLPRPPPFPYTTLFRSEADPEHPRLELRHQCRRGLDRKPRLARATRSGQGEQSGTVLEKRDDVLDLPVPADERARRVRQDRKSTRLNSSHVSSSYAVFC